MGLVRPAWAIVGLVGPAWAQLGQRQPSYQGGWNRPSRALCVIIPGGLDSPIKHLWGLGNQYYDQGLMRLHVCREEAVSLLQKANLAPNRHAHTLCLLYTLCRR